MQTLNLHHDHHLKGAKEAGLNFNVLCVIWLFDVGVTKQTASGNTSRYGKPIGNVFLLMDLFYFKKGGMLTSGIYCYCRCPQIFEQMSWYEPEEATAHDRSFLEASRERNLSCQT